MQKIKLLIAVATAAFALSLGGKVYAQPQGGGGGGGGGMDWQNMDPQELQKMMQQRMLDSYRDQMAVTNDDEWTVIAERISAVSQARMATMADGGGMMGFGGMRGGPGGGGPGGGGPGGGFRGMFGQPSAESQALQQAVEDNVPAAQLKTLMEKYQAVRKDKLAKLAKAQEDLRAVLTTRQEAIALLGGLLN
jgi:hypothetical protein